MLHILQEMRQEYTCHCGRGGKGVGRGEQGDRGQGRERINRRTIDNANFALHIIDQYCYTHGGCNHISRDSPKKAAGHNDAATIQNRLGGSNAFCQPVAGR